MSTAREKIIHAATQLFDENGFGEVTTKEIAQKAGVSEVTVFRNFESKRALFSEILKNESHPFKVHQYLSESATYDLETDVKAIANMLMDTLEKNLPLMRMVFRDSHSSGERKRVAHRDHEAKECILEYFTKMHELGRISVPPKMAMRFLFSNLRGVLTKAMFHSVENVDREYFDWMVDKIIEVIR
ncbi:MAG: helix-turn-helix domain-containing protein [Eubacteriales bacterium]